MPAGQKRGRLNGVVCICGCSVPGPQERTGKEKLTKIDVFI